MVSARSCVMQTLFPSAHSPLTACGERGAPPLSVHLSRAYLPLSLVPRRSFARRLLGAGCGHLGLALRSLQHVRRKGVRWDQRTPDRVLAIAVVERRVQGLLRDIVEIGLS